MTNNNENLDSKEKEQIPDFFAWIFDVDGVITNPQLKKITELKILDYIIEKLEIDEPVALNTGRSVSWIKERVLNPLVLRISDKKALKNLFIVCEFGSIWLTFDKKGSFLKNVDRSMDIPKELSYQVEEIIKKDFSDSMDFDKTKETMISTEMKDGFSIEKYKLEQKKLVDQLKKLIFKRGVSANLKVHSDLIGTNVISIEVGKDFATEKIAGWVKKNYPQNFQFITFGDSISDLDMGNKLYDLGYDLTFVFVGDSRINKNTYKFPIMITEEKFDKGTLEYLSSICEPLRMSS